MTLPLDTPTAKPPADLAPAQAPALPPTSAAPTTDPVAAIADTAAPAIVQALRDVDPYAYFATMCRTDPHLFHKWASLLLGSKRNGNAMQQNVINVVTAIPKGPLDELPPGFTING